jgi:hypothetical protein
VEIFRGDYPQWQRHIGGLVTPAQMVRIGIFSTGVVLLLVLPRLPNIPKPKLGNQG